MEFINRFFEIISPILYGIALAYFFSPLQNFFEYKLLVPLTKKSEKRRIVKLRRIISMILTLLILSFVLVAAVYIIIPEIAESVEKLAGNLSTYISRIDDSLDSYFENHLTDGSFIGRVYANIRNSLSGDGSRTLISTLAEKTSEWLIGLFSEDNLLRIFSLGTSVIGILINVTLAVIIMICLLFSKERQAARIRKFLTAYFKKERVERIYRLAYMTDERVGRFVRTRVVESILVGLVSFIVYVIFDFPYAPLLALIAGVTNIIPYFGPFIGAVPAGILVLMAAPGKLLVFLIIVLIVQQIDGNVLAPIMQSNSMKIDSFWVLAGLTIMGGIFGLPGMILGVPVFAVVYILIKEKTEARLKRKGLPLGTDNYEVLHHERKRNYSKPPIVRFFKMISNKIKGRKSGDPDAQNVNAEDGDPADGQTGYDDPGPDDPGPEGAPGTGSGEDGTDASEKAEESDVIDRGKRFVKSASDSWKNRKNKK